LYILRLLSLFHLTSDAHPVVRPETLLFPNKTYIFFYQLQKKRNIFFLPTDNFLNRYYYLPFDKLSIISFFFFINSDKISRWMFRILSTVHIFYGITTTRWFHLHQIRLEWDNSLLRLRDLSCCMSLKTFPRKQSIYFLHSIIVKWRVYIIYRSDTI